MPQGRKTFLQDAERARIAWHDAKKHATLLRMFLSNLHGGAYGAMPESSMEAFADVERVLEEHLLLLDTLSIVSRDANNALHWTASACNGAEILADVRRLSKNALAGRELLGDSPGTLSVDPSLFLYLLRSAVVVMARTTMGPVTITIATAESGSLNVVLQARALADLVIPEDYLSRAILLEHTAEPWQGISFCLAGIDAVMRNIDGSVSLSRQGDDMILVVQL